MRFPTARRAQGDAAGGGAGAPTIGVALGAGAARGWAHIGVLQELEAAGLSPGVIVGSSIGAVVGGSFAAGKLADIEAFARSVTKRRMFGLLDFSFAGGGIIGGRRLQMRLDEALGETQVEDLPYRFAAVATEVGTGHEIWLTRGRLSEAIRASYALPGIFEPVQIGRRWLFDGALVNPVPVTACRALGADMVIAVNLIADSLWRGTVIQDHGHVERKQAAAEARADEQAEQAAPAGGWFFGLRGPSRPQLQTRAAGGPGLATVMVDAFNITQDRIARSRLAGDPPDAMIGARLGGVGLFDFHRADEVIALGRDAARRAIGDIKEQIGMLPSFG